VEIATILGILIGLGGILGGNAVEGGTIDSLVQGPAAIIIAGGTFGAMLVSFPMPVFNKAMKNAYLCFKPPRIEVDQIIDDIVAMARIARKDGLLALERNLEEVQDPFMKKYLQQIIDGIEADLLQDQMETQIFLETERTKLTAKVWEGGGGYAPTIGIIGAVLGLILVMANLSDPSKLGGGIAVAFVATVYGLVLANLFMIPMGTKIKIFAEARENAYTMIMEGLLALQAGHNPKVIEDKLRIYADKEVKKDDES